MQIAIDEQLFTWPSESPALLGSRCACGVATFPTQSGCPRCGAEMECVELPTRGSLWTWTTQGFRPKGPPEGYYRGDDTEETFVPYSLGYVELPGHCKVETRLVGPGGPGVAPGEKDFTIGDEMELVVVPFRKDDDGNDVMTFAFRRVGG